MLLGQEVSLQGFQEASSISYPEGVVDDRLYSEDPKDVENTLRFLLECIYSEVSCHVPLEGNNPLLEVSDVPQVPRVMIPAIKRTSGKSSEQEVMTQEKRVKDLETNKIRQQSLLVLIYAQVLISQSDTLARRLGCSSMDAFKMLTKEHVFWPGILSSRVMGRNMSPPVAEANKGIKQKEHAAIALVNLQGDRPSGRASDSANPI